MYMNIGQHRTIFHVQTSLIHRLLCTNAIANKRAGAVTTKAKKVSVDIATLVKDSSLVHQRLFQSCSAQIFRNISFIAGGSC